uniref:Uncharacterized protein n=1 Tax=Megaselia scalaris TaxID=36166 RepID=T1H2M1_MEGSC
MEVEIYRIRAFNICRFRVYPDHTMHPVNAFNEMQAHLGIVALHIARLSTSRQCMKAITQSITGGVSLRGTHKDILDILQVGQAFALDFRGGSV